MKYRRKRSVSRRALAAEALEPRLLLTVDLLLLRDIGMFSDDVHDITTIGETTYFVASSELEGEELWKTDGTAAGTLMVKDIFPGVAGSHPGSLINLGGTLVFSADDGISGRELWQSDGTAAGTVLLRDIQSGAGSSSPANLTPVGADLFFIAEGGNLGAELWKTDGTTAGTVVVKENDATERLRSFYRLTDVDGILFFAADDGSTGRELWKSDGTDAGTVLVKDIRSGGSSSLLGDLTNVGGTLFFRATSGLPGTELWISDGTEDGTRMVKDIHPSGSSIPTSLTASNGALFFTASDGANGRELWTSDGTADGTVMVADIDPAGSGNPRSLKEVGGALFFRADDGASGYELWKSDGTQNGTLLVKDIRAGNASSYPDQFFEVGGTLYFQAHDGVSGFEPWKSDGTSEGTLLVKDLNPGVSSSYPRGVTATSHGTLFTASDGQHIELYTTDGTEAGTAALSSGQFVSPTSSFPIGFAQVGHEIFFSAGGPDGAELWKTDGTRAGTQLVKDIFPGGFGSYPMALTSVGGTLFFTAETETAGRELWKSDGTAAGTVQVKDIFLGTSGSYPASLVDVNGRLFFQADDDLHGEELWSSDGTEAGTVLVKDISPLGNSYPNNLLAVGGTLFFAADDGVNGEELWKSDGTELGTEMVKDINPTGSGFPYGMVDFKGELFFAAQDADGFELWKSDGTAAGTVQVKDINLDSESRPRYLTPVQGSLFFTADDGVHDRELWVSDGTMDGTVLVKDIAEDFSSYPYELVAFGNQLLLAAADGNGDTELWRSDGTAAGTQLIKNINPDDESRPANLTKVRDLVFFSADDGVHGRELWQSDGTTEGTSLAADLRSGGADSDPSYLTFLRGQLYLAASDALHGNEPWRTLIPPPASVQLPAGTGNATVAIEGPDLVVRADESGEELFRAPIVEVETLTITGNDQDNTFTVELSLLESLADLPAGVDATMPGLIFEGGEQGTQGDTLQIVGNPATAGEIDQIIYTPSDPSGADGSGSGTLTLVDQNVSRKISFTGLEPLLISAESSVIVVDTTDLAMGTLVQFGDEGEANDGLSKVEFPALDVESLWFLSPTATLQIIGHEQGTDSVTIQAADASFTANIHLELQGGDDLVTLDYSTGMLRGAIDLDAGDVSEANMLTIEGEPASPIGRESYLVGATADAGKWVLDPNDSAGAGAPAAGFDGDELTIDFSGLTPVTTAVSAVQFDLILAGGVDVLSIADATLGGGAALEISPDANTFESTRLANKQFVRIHAGAGADEVEIATSVASSGLSELEVFGFAAADVAAALALTDDLADTQFVVRATAANVVTRLMGEGGAERLAVGDGSNTLDAILGDLHFEGGAGSDTLLVFDHGSPGGSKNIILSSSTIDGLTALDGSGGQISYAGLDNGGAGTGRLEIQTSGAGHTITVHSTAADLQETVVTTGDGDDTITIRGDGASGPADSANGLVSPLRVTMGQGVDSLVVVDSQDSTDNLVSLDSSEIEGIFGAGGVVRYTSAPEHLSVQLGSGSDQIEIDVSDVAALQAVSSISVQGGDESGGLDQLRVLAAGGALVDLAFGRLSNVNSTSVPDVLYSEVELIEVVGQATPLTVQAGPGDDLILIQPTASDMVDIEVGTLLLRGSALSDLTLDADSDGGGGQDHITVRATAQSDDIQIEPDGVNIAGLIPVGFARHESLTIEALDGDDQLEVDQLGGLLPIVFDGGGGHDELVLNDGSQAIGLDPLRNIERLDIRGAGPNSLDVKVEAVQANGAVDPDPLAIVSDTDDQVEFDAGWSLTGTRIMDGLFFREITRAGATLLLNGPRNWNNPLSSVDVNADGDVIAFDVLFIVNQLNARTLLLENGQLMPAESVDPFPGFYYDVDANGFATPLDALRVINVLNAAGEGEAEAGVSAEAPFLRSNAYIVAPGRVSMGVAGAPAAGLSVAPDGVSPNPAASRPSPASSRPEAEIAARQPTQDRFGSAEAAFWRDLEEILDELVAELLEP